MPSFRSRLFVLALKYRHLLQGKLRRVTKIDPATSLQELRETVEKGADFWGKLSDGFQLERVNANGVDAEWMLPANVIRDQGILYFHGGGLVVGSIEALSRG